jgi:hypothetical protein
MGSLFQRHRARALGQLAATQAAGKAGVRTGAAANEYALQRVRLGVDLRRLKEIQSIERKVELKRELLPHYLEWVAGVLAADSGAEDDVLTHAMIWSIDIGAFDAALPLAAYVIRHHLTLPERFSRTAPTYVCEEIAEAAIKRLGQDPDPEDDDNAVANILRTLRAVEELVADQDIFDEVRAKLEKAMGLALLRSADAIAPDADGPAGARRGAQERGLRHLRRALELDKNTHVKKRIDQVERDLKRTAETTTET